MFLLSFQNVVGLWMDQEVVGANKVAKEDRDLRVAQFLSTQ